MALTEFQRSVCRLLAHSRILSGESYLAGGDTLNELLQAARVSRDVDLFHDTESALDATWQSDRRLLEQGGFSIRLVRERRSFVEAEVSREGESVLVQWVQDSAYRFFPLLQHPELGLTLHPFDLATNKVLALVGRLERRQQRAARAQPCDATQRDRASRGRNPCRPLVRAIAAASGPAASAPCGR